MARKARRFLISLRIFRRKRRQQDDRDVSSYRDISVSVSVSIEKTTTTTTAFSLNEAHCLSLSMPSPLFEDAEIKKFILDEYVLTSHWRLGSSFFWEM
jgi:hypothetical protein